MAFVCISQQNNFQEFPPKLDLDDPTKNIDASEVQNILTVSIVVIEKKIACNISITTE